MRWQGRRKSDNVEDRRGIGGRGLAVGGGLGGLIIVALFLLLGGNPDEVMQNLQIDGTSSPAAAGQPLSEKDKEMGDFVSVGLRLRRSSYGPVLLPRGQKGLSRPQFLR